MLVYLCVSVGVFCGVVVYVDRRVWARPAQLLRGFGYIGDFIVRVEQFLITKMVLLHLQVVVFLVLDNFRSLA